MGQQQWLDRYWLSQIHSCPTQCAFQLSKNVSISKPRVPSLPLHPLLRSFYFPFPPITSAWGRVGLPGAMCYMSSNMAVHTHMEAGSFGRWLSGESVFTNL